MIIRECKKKQLKYECLDVLAYQQISDKIDPVV